MDSRHELLKSLLNSEESDFANPRNSDSGKRKNAKSEYDHEHLQRPAYVDTRSYWWMVGRFMFVSLVVLLILGMSIWAFVLEGENSDGIKKQGARMDELDRKLWEKCTPDANPPTTFKDSGTYILADPTDVQFPLGWTSASHRCLPRDPDSVGIPGFGIWFDGTLELGSGHVLDGSSIRPTFSDPAYLTQWTGAPLTIATPNRCTLPTQDNSIYLVLQASYAPFPCICAGSVELCYHYPDPNNLEPVFLNTNKEIP